jgi:tetratricopeptide (TPR) repeat protein
VLIALVLLLAQTLTRRTAALVALGGLLLVGQAQAQVTSRGDLAGRQGRFAEAARAYLEDAASGQGVDTAFYNAGTAALAAEQFDLARQALGKAAASLDPGLRYRALYNLGVVDLIAAGLDSVHAATLRDQAAKNFQEALLLEPGSRRAKWNLELARRNRPPPPSGGNNSPPPPSGGGSPPPHPADQPERRDLSSNQAEQILNSVDREEQETRAKHMNRVRNAAAGVKDW